MLTKKDIIKKEYNIRDIYDRRVKIDRYTVSYYNNQGIEYRRSFKVPVKTQFKDVIIPDTIPI